MTEFQEMWRRLMRLTLIDSDLSVGASTASGGCGFRTAPSVQSTREKTKSSDRKDSILWHDRKDRSRNQSADKNSNNTGRVWGASSKQNLKVKESKD